MAQAILLRGGVGGVSSDDVTAGKAQVLKGYKTVTTDSDDEIAEGTIKSINTADDNYNINKSNAFGLDGFGRMWIDMPHGNGYYCRYDNKPHTCIDSVKLGDATADKVVAGSTFTSKNGVNVQGQIADRGYGGAVSYLQGREDWANRIWVLFKNGWYHRDPYDDGHGNIHEAFVYVTYEQIKNLFGIDASKMLQGYSVAGVPGAIPQWTSPSHVVSAVNNEGFVWDDDTGANRGRGIVSKIPTGHYIQNASFVFLPSGNLYPQNVVRGININGVTGTRDWADRTNEYAINSNVSVSQLQNNQPIALGNAFSGSETLFIGVDLVGVDVDSGFVRRDKGNGRRNIGRMPLGKNDSNFVATFIRRCPVQVEITRDWAGNMSFILHIPYDWGFGQTQFYVYVYGHSSMQNNF